MSLINKAKEKLIDASYQYSNLKSTRPKMSNDKQIEKIIQFAEPQVKYAEYKDGGHFVSFSANYKTPSGDTLDIKIIYPFENEPRTIDKSTHNYRYGTDYIHIRLNDSTIYVSELGIGIDEHRAVAELRKIMLKDERLSDEFGKFVRQIKNDGKSWPGRYAYPLKLLQEITLIKAGTVYFSELDFNGLPYIDEINSRMPTELDKNIVVQGGGRLSDLRAWHAEAARNIERKFTSTKELSAGDIKQILRDPLSSEELKGFPNPKENFNAGYFTDLVLIYTRPKFHSLSDNERSLDWLNIVVELLGKDSIFIKYAHNDDSTTYWLASTFAKYGVYLDDEKKESDGSEATNFVLTKFLPEIRKIDEDAYRKTLTETGWGKQKTLTDKFMQYCKDYLFPKILSNSLTDTEKDFIKVNSHGLLWNMISDPTIKSFPTPVFGGKFTVDLEEFRYRLADIILSHELWSRSSGEISTESKTTNKDPNMAKEKDIVNFNKEPKKVIEDLLFLHFGNASKMVGNPKLIKFFSDLDSSDLSLLSTLKSIGTYVWYPTVKTRVEELILTMEAEIKRIVDTDSLRKAVFNFTLHKDDQKSDEATKKKYSSIFFNDPLKEVQRFVQNYHSGHFENLTEVSDDIKTKIINVFIGFFVSNPSKQWDYQTTLTLLDILTPETINSIDENNQKLLVGRSVFHSDTGKDKLKNLYNDKLKLKSLIESFDWGDRKSKVMEFVATFELEKSQPQIVKKPDVGGLTSLVDILRQQNPPAKNSDKKKEVSNSEGGQMSLVDMFLQNNKPTAKPVDKKELFNTGGNTMSMVDIFLQSNKPTVQNEKNK